MLDLDDILAHIIPYSIIVISTKSALSIGVFRDDDDDDDDARVAARPGGAKRLECTVETIFLHPSNWWKPYLSIGGNHISQLVKTIFLDLSH